MNQIVESIEIGGETMAGRFDCGCAFKGDFTFFCTKHETEFGDEYDE